jgi:hypothetical protein
MVEQYVDLDNDLMICSRSHFTRNKHPGLIVKRLKVELTDDDLQRLGAARFQEPASPGYQRTGKAVLVDSTYYREYVDQTPAEAAAQRLAALRATDADMPRALEDLIDTHIRLGTMTFQDLPQATRDRMTDKRDKRDAL